MRLYNKTHRYYCGIDLHARTMHGYIVDQAIEHYFRDAQAIRLELGMEEEQKDAIAEKILG